MESSVAGEGSGNCSGVRGRRIAAQRRWRLPGRGPAQRQRRTAAEDVRSETAMTTRSTKILVSFSFLVLTVDADGRDNLLAATSGSLAPPRSRWVDTEEQSCSRRLNLGVGAGEHGAHRQIQTLSPAIATGGETLVADRRWDTGVSGDLRWVHRALPRHATRGGG
ncbi:hypothetical protein E2562_034547 [Oryza meyeriana var. granulata]|uniref:Uncharacterized protein n=1 Tax=Oryza meyeriana var. granulata TaxID=110450 RepID=A0A6G1EEM9_9ORYZ|nr:hypothetical protein E2562_034547 [Oryza meyeriana var. granulata]